MKPWTDQDDSDLLDYDEQRWPLERIAEALGRTKAECADRLEALKPKAP